MTLLRTTLLIVVVGAFIGVSGVAMSGGGVTAVAAVVQDRDCADFATQAEAQAYFDEQGYTAGDDPERLDTAAGIGNGIACEGLPPGDRAPIADLSPDPVADGVAPVDDPDLEPRFGAPDDSDTNVK